MKPSEFRIKQWVAYVPLHATGNVDHPDVEIGLVSSVNDANVFVKYEKQLLKFGWDGTTSQATAPCDLIALPDRPGPTPPSIRWIDTVRCQCQACVERAMLYRCCLESRSPLYVLDCRMYQIGWIVDDVRSAHDKPSESPHYPTIDAACDAVFKTQQHCHVYVSSWPLKPDSLSDYLWKCEIVERVPSVIDQLEAAGIKVERFTIDVCDRVICDWCGDEWTDRPESGGITFGSKACCPACAPKIEADAVTDNETHFIRARCPAELSFANWVRDVLRAAP